MLNQPNAIHSEVGDKVCLHYLPPVPGQMKSRQALTEVPHGTHKFFLPVKLLIIICNTEMSC